MGKSRRCFRRCPLEKDKQVERVEEEVIHESAVVRRVVLLLIHGQGYLSNCLCCPVTFVQKQGVLECAFGLAAHRSVLFRHGGN